MYTHILDATPAGTGQGRVTRGVLAHPPVPEMWLIRAGNLSRG